ncbi:uncharacterized protein LOC124162751 [Ischnura elegans]|uniref:uncharacterized protein LOC124162751 n=1 Tax=Ischnura elegans TaxID=197161 RepID=UPI001ED887E5|nr:uncharacterized protein LOC124162751 [Ischnura elegans]XP_046395343.1 uncharacterized protein LOC124162751 [Ischnura elegans]XP_046395344.1 uncharacterized protein LOC124162751 [Ischnura elegans]XP_046395345.1 uncharacterized protein LOC124162751 [Ischnura elegans]
MTPSNLTSRRGPATALGGERMKMAGRLLVLLLSLSLVLLIPATRAADDDWTICPAACKCKWVSGRKAAECVRSQLLAVPEGLSQEVQSLDLSENRFVALPANAFRTVNLVNLHKVFLKNCHIERLDRDAFSGLEILIELDLTGNRIKTILPGTFRDNIRLRLLFIGENPIKKLDDGLFQNLTFLQTVDASQCQITHIGHKTFINVPNLQHLKLEGNNLYFLKLAAVESLKRLKSLVLHNNKWLCDCHLRPLRDWAVNKNLYALPTSCHEPERLAGKMWTDISSRDFACKPDVIAPYKEVRGALGSNVTMSCKVMGDPPPETLWVLNGRVVGNTTVPMEAGYGNGHVIRWSNWTLANLRSSDRGEYTCVAKNPAGMSERNVTLIVGGAGSMGDGGVLGGAIGQDYLPILIGVILGILLLLLITLIVYCCCCQRRWKSHARIPRNKKSDVLSPNGEIVGNGNTEQEKSLLTVVNPVQKPPRRYESQPSCNNMEITELNRTLLDTNGTLPLVRGPEGPVAASYGSRGEDSDDHMPDHSMDSLDTTATRSHDALDAESVRSDGRPYPDLLTFPPRASQDSPAGSSASTAPDHSALPSQPPAQRPPPSTLPPLALHSPMSPTHPHHPAFGTLPYSRSQSPFSPPGSGSAPSRHHPQGYVTIPRRPRVPSWAAPSAVRSGEPLIKVEPIYDNLGPRTTADGSSVLSLNKSPVEATPPPLRPSPSASAPPATPVVHFNQSLPAYYTTIEELEPVPSPAPTRASLRSSPTVPRGPEPGTSQTTPPAKKLASSSPHGNSRSSPEGASLKRLPNRVEDSPARLVEDTGTPTVNGGVKKGPKVPPKPPPKPKKKPSVGAGVSPGVLAVGSNSGSDSAFGSEPLYEDEGEDGTEV